MDIKAEKQQTLTGRRNNTMEPMEKLTPVLTYIQVYRVYREPFAESIPLNANGSNEDKQS